MATATAGPSRLPTISTEDEEIAAESGVVAETSATDNGDGAGGPTVSEPIPEPAPIPDVACETLYIQNLNEKVQVEGTFSQSMSVGRNWCGLAVMKHTLQNLFKTYRPVLPVVAHRNVRMRGQAFVSFPNADLASKAKKEVNEFPLYGKAMVRPARVSRWTSWWS
jgi:U2 small nuclear ribonucleoprotein B''